MDEGGFSPLSRGLALPRPRSTSTSSRRFYRSPGGNKREITFHPRSPLRGISLNFLHPPAVADSQIETSGFVLDRISQATVRCSV